MSECWVAAIVRNSYGGSKIGVKSELFGNSRGQFGNCTTVAQTGTRRAAGRKHLRYAFESGHRGIGDESFVVAAPPPFSRAKS